MRKEGSRNLKPHTEGGRVKADGSLEVTRQPNQQTPCSMGDHASKIRWVVNEEDTQHRLQALIDACMHTHICTHTHTNTNNTTRNNK